jgi:hypothetical protein
MQRISLCFNRKQAETLVVVYGVLFTGFTELGCMQYLMCWYGMNAICCWVEHQFWTKMFWRRSSPIIIAQDSCVWKLRKLVLNVLTTFKKKLCWWAYKITEKNRHCQHTYNTRLCCISPLVKVLYRLQG